MRQFFREIIHFSNRVKNDNISVYAAYGTLFIMLSFVPFLMLLLAILPYLPISAQLTSDQFRALLPDIVEPLVSSIIADLLRKNNTTILSISAVAALWSASKGVLGLYQGMNCVYHCKERRNIVSLRAICLFYTLVLYVIVILTMILMIFGEQIQLALLRHFEWLRTFDQMISFLRLLISIVFQTFFFMLIYKVFPNRKASIWTQIPGALVSSVGWMLFSYGFSLYIKYFSNYSNMYGSLTAIVITILWVYVCFSITLFGGELNAWLEESDTVEA